MARNGITYADVATASEQLIAENKSPTIEGVRGLLGTGSITTITKHLKLWKEQQGTHAKLEHELPESLLITVKGLHQAMTAEANSKVETLEAEHLKASKDLKKELTALQQTHNQTLQANRQLEQDKAELIEEKQALNRHINAQKEVSRQQEQDIQLLNERLSDKKSDIANLQQQLTNAQTNLEHYCEATRQEREKERLNFESKGTQLEQSLRQSQAESAQSKAEVDKFKEHHNELKEQLQRQSEQLKDSEAKHQQLNVTHAVHLKHHQQLQVHYDTLKAESQNREAQLDAAEQQMQTLLLNEAQNEERVKGLRHALAKAEDRIAVLTDKHLLLVHEKAELVASLAHYETNSVNSRP